MIAAAAGLALWRKYLEPHDRRTLLLLACGGALVCAGLIYVLAVDPKARMFLALAAAVALSLGAFASAAWRSGQGVSVTVLIAGLIGVELLVLCGEYTTHGAENAARAWIKANPGRIEIDPSALNMLTLVKEVKSLPLRGSGMPLVMAVTGSRCESLLSNQTAARLVDQEARAKASHGGLCLFSY